MTSWEIWKQNKYTKERSLVDVVRYPRKSLAELVAKHFEIDDGAFSPYVYKIIKHKGNN